MSYLSVIPYSKSILVVNGSVMKSPISGTVMNLHRVAPNEDEEVMDILFDLSHNANLVNMLCNTFDILPLCVRAASEEEIESMKKGDRVGYYFDFDNKTYAFFEHKQPKNYDEVEKTVETDITMTGTALLEHYFLILRNKVYLDNL